MEPDLTRLLPILGCSGEGFTSWFWVRIGFQKEGLLVWQVKVLLHS